MWLRKEDNRILFKYPMLDIHKYYWYFTLADQFILNHSTALKNPFFEFDSLFNSFD